MMRPKLMNVLLLALMFALAGCGAKKGAGAPVGQAAARVNGETINAQDIDRELAKAGMKNSPQAQDAANRLLNVLLEQRLFAQQAKKGGLEKDPNVAQALQAAQRQVLAQAYVDKLTAGAVKAGDGEAKEYYDKHPELFSARRIYRLQEIMIQVSPENAAAVKARLGSGANLNELVQWLKSQNIPTRGAQSVKSAEQLPLDLAAKLQLLKDGQALTLEAPNAITILAVTGSQNQPLTFDQAKPVIERYLLAMHKREMAKSELDKLRAAAKIEYVAPYAEVKSAGHVVSAVPKEESGEQMIDKALSSLK